MKTEERAAQFWPILVLAARNQQIVSYSFLEKLTGLEAKGQASVLGRIERYCTKYRMAHLTAIVVNQDTGIPGHLYPGFNPNQKNRQALAQDAAVYALRVLQDQSSVFVFDWLRRKAPIIKDFIF